MQILPFAIFMLKREVPWDDTVVWAGSRMYRGDDIYLSGLLAPG